MHMNASLEGMSETTASSGTVITDSCEVPWELNPEQPVLLTANLPSP